jgi:MFS family permease
MFLTVLWYVSVFVDATPLSKFVSGIIGFDWHFDIEHVTVISAGTIVLLQLIISKIVERTPPTSTIIVGFTIATLGMFLLSFSSNIWIFVAGLFVFSIGEMTAHPKYISYLGLIAPPDKKATYLGFGFLYGVIGAFFANFIGSRLYTALVTSPILDFIKKELAA